MCCSDCEVHQIPHLCDLACADPDHRNSFECCPICPKYHACTAWGEVKDELVEPSGLRVPRRLKKKGVYHGRETDTD